MDKQTSGQADNANLLVNSSTRNSSADNGRRSFLLAAAIATTGAALAQEKKKVDGGLAAIEDKIAPERLTPLTPPGSMSAQHFAQHDASRLNVGTALRPALHGLPALRVNMSQRRAASVDGFVEVHAAYNVL